MEKEPINSHKITHEPSTLYYKPSYKMMDYERQEVDFRQQQSTIQGVFVGNFKMSKQ